MWRWKSGDVVEVSNASVMVALDALGRSNADLVRRTDETNKRLSVLFERVNDLGKYLDHVNAEKRFDEVMSTLEALERARVLKPRKWRSKL